MVTHDPHAARFATRTRHLEKGELLAEDAVTVAESNGPGRPCPGYHPPGHYRWYRNREPHGLLSKEDDFEVFETDETLGSTYVAEPCATNF